MVCAQNCLQLLIMPVVMIFWECMVQLLSTWHCIKSPLNLCVLECIRVQTILQVIFLFFYFKTFFTVFLAAFIQKLSYSEREQFSCEACQGVSKFVEAEITDPVINKELVHGLTSLICNHVPKAFYNVCNNFAQGTIPLMLTRIEQFIGNGKICKNIHAC